jgi:hypothetical protein
MCEVEENSVTKIDLDMTNQNIDLGKVEGDGRVM